MLYAEGAVGRLHATRIGENSTMDMSPDDYVWEMKQYRHQKDQFFATSPDAPIPAQERKQFQGLRYFEPDPAYRVEAELERFPAPEVVQLGTTTGRITQHYRYGEVRFTLDGQACRLTAYNRLMRMGMTRKRTARSSSPSATPPPGRNRMARGAIWKWRKMLPGQIIWCLISIWPIAPGVRIARRIAVCCRQPRIDYRWQSAPVSGAITTDICASVANS